MGGIERPNHREEDILLAYTIWPLCKGSLPSSFSKAYQYEAGR